MKRFFVSTFSLLALTGPAVAAQTVTVGRTYGPYDRPDCVGGHQLTLRGDGVPGLAMESPLQSFCIEMGAEVRSMRATTDGGAAASDRVTPTSDPLTPEADLYQSLVQGTSAGPYDSVRGLGRGTFRVLRAATWFVQGRSGSLLDFVNANPDWHLSSLEYAWANESIGEAQGSGWTSIGDVRVLNLSSWAEGEPPAHGQDMLVLLVPAPGAVALGAMGLGILGWFRRRPGI